MAGIGSWTATNTARLTKHGAVEYDDGGIPVSVTDVYTVLVPSASTRLDVADVSGLPDIDDPHPKFSDLVVTGYRIAECSAGELFREISCIYGRPGETETSSSGTAARITAIDYPTYTQSGDLVADQVSGDTVLNSAGDVFDSVPQIDRIFTGVHFTRHVSSFPASALALAGTVNSHTVNCLGITFPPRTARLSIGCRYDFDATVRPYVLDITLEPHHNIVPSTGDFLPTGVISSMGYASVSGGYDLGWDIALLECGFQFVDGSGELVRFSTTSETGQVSAPQLPQPLTSAGGDGRDAAQPAFLIVRVAQGDSWSTLNLPSSAP